MFKLAISIDLNYLLQKNKNETNLTFNNKQTLPQV